MKCIYFCYCDYCDKFYNIDKYKYGYADLTEYPCEYKDNQSKCVNFKENKKQENIK